MLVQINTTQIAILMVLSLCATGIFAQELRLPLAEEEDDVFGATFGFYWQLDQPDHTGGNPKLDEDEFVFEMILLLDKTLSERDRLNVKVIGDIISAASQARMHNPEYRALQANPSGNKRISGDIGYAHTADKLTIGGHAGYSLENNYYMSWLYGLRFSMPTPSNNTIVSVRLDGFTDYFQIKLFNGQEPGFSFRQSLALNSNVQQVLTPLDMLNISLDYTLQFGILETTYYSIFVNGIEQAEKMPGERHRGALSGRWKHSFTEQNATELGYRFYLDSWNIFSHTVEAKLFQYLFYKHLLLEPGIRFYTQTAAYFFQRQFSSLPPLRTSDTDLGAFSGAIFSLKASLIQLAFFPSFFDSVTFGGNYWLRDDRFQVFWFEFGVLSRF